MIPTQLIRGLSSTIEGNLEVMTGVQKGNLTNSLSSMVSFPRDSMWAGCGGGSTFFKYDPQTGRISEFCGSGYTGLNGTLNLALENFGMVGGPARIQIVSYDLDDKPSALALSVLKASFERYNRSRGIAPEIPVRSAYN